MPSRFAHVNEEKEKEKKRIKTVKSGE